MLVGLQESSEVSLPVAAVKVLCDSIKNHKASTMSEFIETMTAASKALTRSNTNYSVRAGCEVFRGFLNDASHDDIGNLESFKEKIIQKGEEFIVTAAGYRQKIADVGLQLIKDDAVILIHSYSRVVMSMLKHAASLNRRFKVIATESRPSLSGERSAKELREMNIPVCLIPDSAVGYALERVDMVLVGAEGVVQNGGLINQIGTYQLAVVAKKAKKPFYAVTESYKFVRMYPLNQSEVCQSKFNFSTDDEDVSVFGGETGIHVDYTPPELVSSLITNLGVLTPSGVVHLLLE